MKVIILLAVVGLLVLLGFLADRVLRKMEDRGWIYYRKKHGTSNRLGDAALNIQSILEPSKRHVIEEKKREPDETRSAAPPD